MLCLLLQLCDSVIMNAIQGLYSFILDKVTRLKKKNEDAINLIPFPLPLPLPLHLKMLITNTFCQYLWWMCQKYFSNLPLRDCWVCGCPSWGLWAWLQFTNSWSYHGGEHSWEDILSWLIQLSCLCRETIFLKQLLYTISLKICFQNCFLTWGSPQTENVKSTTI